MRSSCAFSEVRHTGRVSFLTGCMLFLLACGTQADSYADTGSGDTLEGTDVETPSRDVFWSADVVDSTDVLASPDNGQPDGGRGTSQGGCDPPCPDGEVCVRDRHCTPTACEQLCRESGKCTFGRDQFGMENCIVGSTADCEISDLCEEFGKCVAYRIARLGFRICLVAAESNADCAVPHGTKGQIPCEAVGECAAESGVCINTSDEDCEKSKVCKVAGLCGHSSILPFCVARSPEHCTQAEVCAYAGYCSYFDGYCAAGSDADCEQSELCETEGRCKYKPFHEGAGGNAVGGLCVTPEDLGDADDAEEDGDGQ